VLIRQNRDDRKRQAIADQQWQTVLLGLSRRMLVLTKAIHSLAAQIELAAASWQDASATSVATQPKGDAMTITATEQRTATPTRWTVDPHKSSVEFAVKTFWGLATVHGSFDRFDGSYENGPDGTTIELRIDAASLDTENTTRDRHLRAAGFFHVAEHPQVRFTSTSVDYVHDGILHVVGHLEAAGTSVLLEFPALIQPIGDSFQIEATTTVDQQELGMTSGMLGMIRRPVTLRVMARLRT
jgi:polyisoprenoid-binding protein YceI